MKTYGMIRHLVQAGFLITCLVIAVKFMAFAAPLEQGLLPDTVRPPGVEAFLPISALVSLKHWLVTGALNPIHPSALVIFGFIVLVSILVKKSFCSWICPVGLISELLFKLRTRLGLKKLTLPIWLDMGLRSLKYLFLFFFVYTIVFQMNGRALDQFVYSAYHIVADIKMLQFFTHVSAKALAVLGLLGLLSVILPFFWCRYLCPYGALLSLAGFLSPVKVRRRAEGCRGCGSCDRACPGGIAISAAPVVNSDNCIACARCVDACPKTDTLTLAFGLGRKSIPAPVIALILVMVFAGGSLAARKADIWENKVPDQAYLTAMMETGLVDLKKVENMNALIASLDSRGKRALMRQFMQMKQPIN